MAMSNLTFSSSLRALRLKPEKVSEKAQKSLNGTEIDNRGAGIFL
jgi:hypothetical protein